MRAIVRSVLLAAAVLPFAANAAVFTDKASYLAATSGLTTITFDNTAPSGNYVSEGASFTTGGATFSDTSIYLLDQSYGSLAAGTQYASDYLEWQNSSPSNLTITLANPSTALGFNFMDAHGYSTAFTITVNGISNTYQSGAAASFFGYTSASAFSTLTISMATTASNGQQAYGAIDNVSYGASASVPEPATWAMMIGGFGMIGLGMRRNRKVSILFG